LAFHPYPQIIRAFFNIQRFGPPLRFTGASPCPRIDHLVSGLLRTTRRPFQTRFRCGFTSRLNLAAQNNSLTHYAKGTQSHCMTEITHSAPTACRRTGSGTFHSPHRGAFHLSLTVLVHYRLPGSIQSCETVLTDSRRIPRVPQYLGVRPGKNDCISSTGLSPSPVRLSRRFGYASFL